MKLAIASVIALGLSASAIADITTLDIPSGYQHDITWMSGDGQEGIAPINFDISSEFIAFSEDNWATPGNVYAWDWDTYTSQIGLITFTADEGHLVSLDSLDLSGWGDYAESAAWIRVSVDGEPVYDQDFYFDGNQGSERLILESAYASQIQIAVENIGIWASVGLDNIAISTMAVPAPGALALLGVAGIAGGRRRRTA
ncbi:MAG: PEP-CTERM sorting domain-containing protein [Planctomycetota bacterium]|jgi:MYXO-CTERM domain-containing protein